MEFKDWMSLSLGGVGTILGLWNAFREHRQSKPRISIVGYVPDHTLPATFQIINTGYVDVSVREVGLILKERGRIIRSGARTEDGDGFPEWLKPGGCFTAVFSPFSDEAIETDQVKWAFARIGTNKVFKGKVQEVKISRAH